jgi:hypothetical protein
MATDKTEVTAQVDGLVRIEIEAALDKIYGKPLMGEVVDVEAVPVRPALPDKEEAKQ